MSGFRSVGSNPTLSADNSMGVGVRELAPYLSPLPGSLWPGVDGLILHPGSPGSTRHPGGPNWANSDPPYPVKTSSRLLSIPLSHKGLNYFAAGRLNPDRESGNCDPKSGTLRMAVGPTNCESRGGRSAQLMLSPRACGTASHSASVCKPTTQCIRESA